VALRRSAARPAALAVWLFVGAASCLSSRLGGGRGHGGPAVSLRGQGQDGAAAIRRLAAAALAHWLGPTGGGLGRGPSGPGWWLFWPSAFCLGAVVRRWATQRRQGRVSTEIPGVCQLRARRSVALAVKAMGAPRAYAIIHPAASSQASAPAQSTCATIHEEVVLQRRRGGLAGSGVKPGWDSKASGFSTRRILRTARRRAAAAPRLKRYNHALGSWCRVQLSLTLWSSLFHRSGQQGSWSRIGCIDHRGRSLSPPRPAHQ